MVLKIVNELQKQDVNFINIIHPCFYASVLRWSCTLMLFFCFFDRPSSLVFFFFWVISSLVFLSTCRLSCEYMTNQPIQNVSLEDGMIKLYLLKEFSKY